METPINEVKLVFSKNISAQNCTILFIKALLIMLLIFINIYIILIFTSKNNSLFQKEKKIENEVNFININISKINNSLLNLNNHEKNYTINIPTINNNMTTNNNINIQNNNISTLNNSKEFPNYYSTFNYYKSEEEKMKAYNKGRVFFESCLEDQLINNKTFIKNENPFISVVIPVYNSEKRIKYTIRSIQNQNITNLEIILVNDFSNERTNQVIKQMEINDPRIVLINNAKNMGTLYSRCIGALSSKGKYIFPLDNDDLFFDEGVLDVVSQEAENGNFDIVEFIAAEHKIYSKIPDKISNSEYSNHKNNLTLYQPELGKFSIYNGFKFGIFDVFLWGKCIKSEVYKKTVNLLGEEIYSKYIIWGEDLIVSYLLFRVAKSFRFIRKYGIFRYKNSETASNHTLDSIYILSHILYMLVILRFLDNSSSLDNEYFVKLSYSFFLNYNRYRRHLNVEGGLFLKKLLQELNNCTYIKVNDKIRIKEISRLWLEMK